MKSRRGIQSSLNNKSKSPSLLTTLINKHISNSNSLVYILVFGILVWIILCIYIHLQLTSGGGSSSGVVMPFRNRLRTRLMIRYVICMCCNVYRANEKVDAEIVDI